MVKRYSWREIDLDSLKGSLMKEGYEVTPNLEMELDPDIKTPTIVTSSLNVKADCVSGTFYPLEGRLDPQARELTQKDQRLVQLLCDRYTHSRVSYGARNFGMFIGLEAAAFGAIIAYLISRPLHP